MLALPTARDLARTRRKIAASQLASLTKARAKEAKATKGTSRKDCGPTSAASPYALTSRRASALTQCRERPAPKAFTHALSLSAAKDILPANTQSRTLATGTQTRFLPSAMSPSVPVGCFGWQVFLYKFLTRILSPLIPLCQRALSAQKSTHTMLMVQLNPIRIDLRCQCHRPIQSAGCYKV